MRVLLRCDASMDELYERYGGPDASAQTRDALLARDRSAITIPEGNLLAGTAS